jgi:hypothetical protein
MVAASVHGLWRRLAPGVTCDTTRFGGGSNYGDLARLVDFNTRNTHTRGGDGLNRSRSWKCRITDVSDLGIDMASASPSEVRNSMT